MNNRYFESRGGIPVKVRSHMRKSVAVRRRVDFDISAPLPWACSHIGGWMAERLEWICHVCEGKSRIEACSFGVDAENGMLNPFFAERILPPLRDRVCVNICNDLCWSQFLPTTLHVHSCLLCACVNVALLWCGIFIHYVPRKPAATNTVQYWLGGATKAPFINFSITRKFALAKV